MIRILFFKPPPLNDPCAPADEKPLLSILVPAYRYGEGVRRILTRLQPLPAEDCELIVFDDSPDDEVAGIVMGWCADTGTQLRYRHNHPALGAAGNWNALIDAAHGRFCLLMHHDEFPLGDAFVERLLQTLRERPEVDVLLLDCVLVAPAIGQSRRHLPTWLRAFVVKRVPQYLFRRNVIGSTSTMAIRRTLYPKFDARLRWLIDVDAYVRLLSVTNRLSLCPQVQIGSVLGRTDSITARLGPGLRKIKNEEQAYLRGIHRASAVWLGPAPDECAVNALLRACETVCWISLRAVTRVAACFGHPPVPRSVVQQALCADATLRPEK